MAKAIGKRSTLTSVETVDEKYLLTFDTKTSLQPTPFSAEQLLVLLSKTPPEHIYERPAKGGGKWKYVTGTWVKKVLNFVAGWDWDFEVIDTKETRYQIIVLGKLTVRIGQQYSKRITIIKQQWGRADIKFKTEIKNGVKVPTDQPLDLGNDYKAATTDALKKCASEMAVASDIYGQNEFKELKASVEIKSTKEEIEEAVSERKQSGQDIRAKK